MPPSQPALPEHRPTHRLSYPEARAIFRALMAESEESWDIDILVDRFFFDGGGEAGSEEPICPLPSLEEGEPDPLVFSSDQVIFATAVTSLVVAIGRMARICADILRDPSIRPATEESEQSH